MTTITKGSETIKQVHTIVSHEQTASKANATNSNEQTTRRTFDQLKRDYETASAKYTSEDMDVLDEYKQTRAAALADRKAGKDTAAARAKMLAMRPAVHAAQDHAAALADVTKTLAAAIAASVVNKLIDPQRKTAKDRETVSASGVSPVMVALKRGIYADLATLDGISTANINAATALKYTNDGDCVTVTADPDAAAAVDRSVMTTLTDGVDLVQTAAAALYEQTAAHGDKGDGWLDMTITASRARRHVLRPGETVQLEDRETTPIQEVYRAVRRAVQSSRAVQTDPKSGYIYIADMGGADDVDTLETIYRRAGRYADIGGYTTDASADRLAGTPAGYSHGGGIATGDIETLQDMTRIVDALNLTERQSAIIRRRLAGYSLEEIASRMGVTRFAIEKAMRKMQDKWTAAGMTAPRGWTDETRAASKDEPQEVEQVEISGGRVVGVYASASAAALVTGVNKGSISAAAKGKRTSAGGYVWRYTAAARA